MGRQSVLIDRSNEQVYIPDDGSYEFKGPSRATSTRRVRRSARFGDTRTEALYSRRVIRAMRQSGGNE